MLPFDGSSLKGVVAGAEAMVAGLLVNRWLELPLDLVVGIPALGLTYLGLLLALGVSDEDRLVFGMLTQRFRFRRRSDAGAYSRVADADR